MLIFGQNIWFQDINIKGLGIGNGWISSKYQTSHSQVLKSLGLISQKTFEELLSIEERTQLYLEKNELANALGSWQDEMKKMKATIGSVNLYDLTRFTIDVTEQNYWHFLQQPHVRKAIHVGNTILDGGMNVR